MSYTYYDRLTALDASFLGLESTGVHMHVGSVGIFDAGPLARAEGGLDFEQILRVVETGLFRAPRLRQKLATIPISGRPVWVDDPDFNIIYHVRHTALPLPGDERQLKRLAGRIFSEKLDRAKPMWELWFVEGLEGGRFAVISKIHHCLVDGVSGVDLLAAFMGRDPRHRADPVDHRWQRRPAPGPLKLATDEMGRRIRWPARAAGNAAAALRRPRRAAGNAAQTASSVAQVLRGSLSPASRTPLNVPIGPHRRYDWTRFDIDAVKEVKQRLGCTLNDVALACVAGAVRSFLEVRGKDVGATDFRAFVPVSTRAESQRGKLGNRVSMFVVPLPVDEQDPGQRARRVHGETARLKRSGQAAGAEILEQLSDGTTPALLTRMSRLAASRLAYNLVVTNVPGPPIPVYLNGAPLLESYPLVPLFENQALGIALFSYAGWLHWGFNADWDVLPDLHDFVRAIDGEFEALRKA